MTATIRTKAGYVALNFLNSLTVATPCADADLLEEILAEPTTCINDGECDGCIDKPRCYGEGIIIEEQS